jgi:hypothetical protein
MFFALLVFRISEPGPPPSVMEFLIIVVLSAAAGGFFGLFMWLALGRRIRLLPSPAVPVTRREMARAMRRRRPTGDPRVDEVVRVAAENIVGVSPVFTVYLPLVTFVFGFGMNVSAATIHLVRSDWAAPFPWLNLCGTVLFLVLLVALLPTALRQRENAHVFLRELDRAAWSRYAAGARNHGTVR